MTTDPSPLDPADASDPTGTAASARRPGISRRSLLAGLGFGAAALTVAKAGGAVGAVAGQLNEPGAALSPAQRVSPPTTSTTSTTTTTLPGEQPDDENPPYDTSLTEVPVTAAEGEIPFPIVVGEDDSCFVLENFGACRSGCSRSHEGVDIMADRGLPVIAVADGTLTKIYEDSGSCGGAGNGWTLTDETNDVVYKFFHLDAHAEGLEVGDSVVAGQVIGYIGETGTSGVCSTQYNNYHLHFEYRPGNSAQNSFDLLERPEHVTFSG